MIRFINLTGQIYLKSEMSHFAFYNTVIDKFMTFNDEQTWMSLEDFIEDHKASGSSELDRYLKLIPDNILYESNNKRN